MVIFAALPTLIGRKVTHLTSKDAENYIKRINQRVVEYARIYGSNDPSITRLIASVGSELGYHYTKTGIPQLSHGKAAVQALQSRPDIQSRAQFESLRSYHKRMEAGLSSTEKKLKPSERRQLLINRIKHQKEVSRKFNEEFDHFYAVAESSPEIQKFLTRGIGGGKPTYEEMEELINQRDAMLEEGVNFGKY